MARIKTVQYQFVSTGLPSKMVEAHVAYCKQKFMEKFSLEADAVTITPKDKVRDGDFNVNVYTSKSENCITSVAEAGAIALAHLREAKKAWNGVNAFFDVWVEMQPKRLGWTIQVAKHLLEGVGDYSPALQEEVKKEAEKVGIDTSTREGLEDWAAYLIMQEAVEISLVHVKKRNKESYERYRAHAHQIAYVADDGTSTFRTSFRIEREVFFELVRRSGLGIRNMTKELSNIAREVRKSVQDKELVGKKVVEAAKQRYGLA